MLRALALTTALIAAPAMAQEDDAPTRHETMLAAGYKAAFTCSAVFNGGKTPEQIALAELDRIYPDYADGMAAAGDAVIDRERKVVASYWAEDMPPRMAVWRPHLGCVQLPPGAEMAAADAVPETELGGTPDYSDRDWPMGDVHPEIATPDALAPVIEAAFDRATYGEDSLTSAVVVVKDGAIIAERYMDGHDRYTAQRTWSVAKSVAASVIGAAVKDGLIAVDEPASAPEWGGPLDPRTVITLENLLHMSSGLYSTEAGNRTDNVYFGGSAVAQEAAQQMLEAPPGARWKYANNDTMLAMRSLRAAIGDDQAYLAYPFEALLWKIGMTHTTPETDWNGDFVMSSQVWTTARDLARLGLLYLNDGLWDGERILAEGWTEYVATPAPAQPDRDYGYGAQWWLAGGVSGLPADAYMARGNRGQYVTVIPSENLVIVRRGYDGRPGEYFDPAAFSADVVEALR